MEMDRRKFLTMAGAVTFNALTFGDAGIAVYNASQELGALDQQKDALRVIPPENITNKELVEAQVNRVRQIRNQKTEIGTRLRNRVIKDVSLAVGGDCAIALSSSIK